MTLLSPFPNAHSRSLAHAIQNLNLFTKKESLIRQLLKSKEKAKEKEREIIGKLLSNSFKIVNKHNNKDNISKEEHKKDNFYNIKIYNKNNIFSQL
jgi:hypothetical protein